MNANESAWIQVNRTRCKPLIIGNIYRPPNQSVDNFLDNLSASLSGIDPNSDKVLLGDFNVNFSTSRKKCKFFTETKALGINRAFLILSK